MQHLNQTGKPSMGLSPWQHSVLPPCPGGTWKPPISGNVMFSQRSYNSREKGVSGRRLTAASWPPLSLLSFLKCQLKGFFCPDIGGRSDSQSPLPTSHSFTISSITALRVIKYQIHWHSLAQKPPGVIEEGATFLHEDSCSSMINIAEDKSQSAFVNTGFQDSRRLLHPAPLTSQGHPPNLAVGALQDALGFEDMVLLYVLQDLISMNTSSSLQGYNWG